MRKSIDIARQIQAAGDPLGNFQVVLAAIDGIARANSGKEASAALRAVLGHYIANSLELADAVLEEARHA